MSTNGINVCEDAEMADCDGEKVVTMMDVLKEQEDFEEDANAVLGASDDKNCTYSKGYVKRQAIYACMTCCTDAKNDPSKWAGVCLACSLTCHENHELIELYTKRNFRCDCGNPNFNLHPCQFTPEKSEFNSENIYNQNFSGVYCICHRPYPDPESNTQGDMIQCIICEDWLHSNHLDAVVPPNDQYSEMICKACMDKNEFLHDYSDIVINKESMDVDILNTSTETNPMNNFNANSNSGIIDVGNENSASNSKTLEGHDLVIEEQTCDKFSSNEAEKDLTPTSLTSNEENKENIVNDKNNETEQNNYVQPEVKVSEETAQENNEDTSKKLEPTMDKTVTIDNHHEEQHLQRDLLPVEPNNTVLDHKENIKEVAPSNEELIDEKKLESGELDVSVSVIKAEIDETKDMVNIENESETDNEPKRERSENEAINKQSENVPITEQSENMAITEQSENIAIVEQSETVGTDDNLDNVAATKQSETMNTAVQTQGTCYTEQSQDVPTTNLSENEHANIVLNKENTVNISESAPIPNQTEDDLSIKDSIDMSHNVSTIVNSDNVVASTQLDQHENLDNKEIVSVSESITVSEADNNLEKNISTDIMDENNTDSIVNKIEQMDSTNSSCGNQLPEKKVNTDPLKRKLSSDGDMENVGVKKSKQGDSNCNRPKGVNKVHHGATFWPSYFRHKLCTCNECISMYKDLSVLFLIDPDDTVTAYERLGQEKTDGKPSSQYEKGMAALSSLGRVQQINALTEYAKLRDKLLDFLKTFKDKKVIVKEEDIKAFFAGMKPVREPDGVYFCR